MEAHLLHPAWVHFPIAFLLLGLALELGGRREDARALLWLGSAALWVAVGLGLLAEKYAEHVPKAWKTLERHEELAYWTAGVFTALSLWRWRSAEKRPWFMAGWGLAAALLLNTAYHGGELVFAFGMGVKP